MRIKSELYSCMQSPCAFTSESPFYLGLQELKYSHKKIRCRGTDEKHNETVKRDFDNQATGLKQRRGEQYCMWMILLVLQWRN